MELLVEKWELAASQPGVNIVRIHAQENEKDMVDAFYTYLLGVDTDNKDIPVIFESIYHDNEQYSKSLLQELKDLIETWNKANKDAIGIELKQIEWEPDAKLEDAKNPAYSFIENMNRFAAYLNLNKNIFLVAALKVSFVQPKSFTQWLEFALKAGLHEHFKIVLDDTAAHPYYEALAEKFRNQVITLRPQLDMDNAMQQVASMGNPNDPGVQYRKAFMLLFQAIEKRKEKDAKEAGALCIEIAEQNIPKNPYWIGQVVAVYAALANDQVGYRNFTKAISYADKGVNAVEEYRSILKDEYIFCKLRAQAIMLRASLFAAAKEWLNAVSDFETSAKLYVSTNDTILAMEAYRMCGYCNDKAGNADEACIALVAALSTSRNLPPHIIKSTTFAGVVELLIQVNNLKHISPAEVEERAREVYGDDWVKEINSWKNPVYETIDDAALSVVA